MLFLAACTPPPPDAPSLDIPVTVPTAEHATAEPALNFVGPLDVATLGQELCGEPDRAGLLRTGQFGWRVFVLAGDRTRLPDGTVTTGGAEAKASLDALAARWARADRLVEKRCGAPLATDVLVAAEAGSLSTADGLVGVRLALGRGGVAVSRIQLLVTDPEPDAALPAEPRPKASMPRPWPSLVGVSQGWVVLWSDGAISTTTGDLPTVIRALAAQSPDSVLFSTNGVRWSTVISGLDALAGLGIPPRFAISVGDEAESVIAPEFVGHSRIAAGDTLSVLSGGTSQLYGPGSLMLLQQLGSSNPDSAVDDILVDPDAIVPAR